MIGEGIKSPPSIEMYHEQSLQRDKSTKRSVENAPPNLMSPSVTSINFHPQQMENQPNQQELLSAERDLQELSKLRLETLESIIQEKLIQLEQLNNECIAERTTVTSLRDQVQERQKVIENYEGRFLQVRSIIEKQDLELRAAHENLDVIRGQLAEEQDNVINKEKEIERQKLENKIELEEAKTAAETLRADLQVKFDVQQVQFEQRLKEKEKWLESLTVQHNLEITRLQEIHAKELTEVRESISRSQTDGNSELDSLKQQLIEKT